MLETGYILLKIGSNGRLICTGSLKAKWLVLKVMTSIVGTILC